MLKSLTIAKCTINLGIVFTLILIISVTSCNTEDIKNNLEEEVKSGIYAVPVLNDTLKITDLFSKEGNARYSTDEDGKITITYEGDVLTEDADIVAPPLVGIGDIEIPDTSFVINYGNGSSNTIDSAVIQGNTILFRYVSIINEELKVKVWIEEIVKDGEPLFEEITIPASNGNKIELTGETIDMAGYSLLGNDNKLTIKYDARTPSGERVKLTRIYTNFNYIKFDYLQGYFPKTERAAEGSFIPIGLYNGWISGSMEFTDPSILIGVINGFGFPVGARFNKMTLNTVGNNTLELQAQQLQDGITFNYPTLEEVGQTKYSSFSFDNSNSNLAELFQNRVNKVTYDVDALANPDDIPNFIGFMTSESFYTVQLKVDVPMNLIIKDLVIQDTLEFNITEKNEYVDSLELKMVLENSYPIDILAQGYLMNDNNEIVDSVFKEPYNIKAAEVNIETGELLNKTKNITYLTLTDDRINKVLDSKKLIFRFKIDTEKDYMEPIWLYDHYEIVVRAGAIFKLK